MQMQMMNKSKNIIIKILITVVLFISLDINNANAQEYNYNWASGYKYRTEESVDDEGRFMGSVIVGGEFDHTVDMQALFPVSQENWSTTDPQCRRLIDNSHMPTPYDCEYVGQPRYGYRTYEYTCSGDVAYTLKDEISSEKIVGGDTTKGAWSMLMSFFPPALSYEVEEDGSVRKACEKDGRCYVANAWVIDTKAQWERTQGLLPGLGTKVLVEGPGEVYYFDQVRAMTQPPSGRYDSINEPVLVGKEVGSLKGCDGALFEQQLGTISFSPDHSAAATFANEIMPALENNPILMEAYAAAEEESGIPCEILAGIHYMEASMDPNKSLLDGSDDLRGGDIIEDARQAARHLRGHMDGTNYGRGRLPETFDGYRNGLTYYNGLGNLNCGNYPDDCRGGALLPTNWRENNKCGGDIFDSSIYALNDWDETHNDLQIIFCKDGGDGCTGICPLPFPEALNPGVLTTAFLVHNALSQ